MTFGVAVALAQLTIHSDPQEPGDNRTHLTSKPTNSNCLLLDLLNLDVRFQIYTNLLPDRNTVQVIDIVNPIDEDSRTLTALMNTNSAIRQDVLLWYSQNTSWLTNTGLRGDNTIQLRPTVQNTKYIYKFTDDFLFWRLQRPQETAAWKRLWPYVSTQETIGPLVIELNLSSSLEIQSAMEWLFVKAHDIHKARNRGAGARPGPMAPFTTSVEFLFPVGKNPNPLSFWEGVLRAWVSQGAHQMAGCCVDRCSRKKWALGMTWSVRES